MNLNDPQHPWSRLTRAARTVADERDSTAPYGFATRVSALALERKAVSLIERFAWRAVGVAGLLAVLSVAVNYSALSRTTTVASEDEPTDDDPIALLLSVD